MNEASANHCAMGPYWRNECGNLNNIKYFGGRGRECCVVVLRGKGVGGGGGGEG